MFKGQIETQTIKKAANILSSQTKLNTSIASNDASNEVRVQLIPQDKFYLTLLKLKIKKDSRQVPNLSNFLRLSHESPDQIHFKKLTRVIEEFLRNHYLKSFGYRKKRLDDQKPVEGSQTASQLAQYGGVEEQEEEYYYYEEDPAEAAASSSQKKPAGQS